MPEPSRLLKVFLSYASQDRPLVRELSRRLVGEGWIDTWQDETSLLPGQDWRVKIEEAVEDSDIIIICLSTNSVSKEGYVQKELRYAREIALEKPEDAIYLIPMRLDECEVPRGLRFYQWADYFGENKDSSYKALITSLNLRYEQKLSAEEAERLRKEKIECEAAEKAAREKAEKEVAEKARLKAEEEERRRIAKMKVEREAAEKVSRENAEKEAAEIARLQTVEQEQQRIAKEKAVREQKNKEARLKKEQATNEKAKHGGVSVEKVNQGKRSIKPEASKPNSGNRIIYWIGGFGLIVFGIILLSSLNNLPAISQAVSGNTQEQEIAALTQGIVDSSATSTLNPQSPMLSVEDSPFELVFVSKEGDYMNLYQLRTNGEKRNLTKDANFSLIANPSLSSDGKVIAFETDKGMFGLHVDTASMMLISSFGNSPHWRPKSNEIVFVSDDTGFSGNLCDMIWQAYARGVYPYDAVVDCINSRTEQGVVLSNQQIYLVDFGVDDIAGGDSPLIDYRGISLPNWNYTGTTLAYVKKENVDFICIENAENTFEITRIGCQQIKDYVKSFDYSPVADEIVYSAEWKGSSNIYLLNTVDFSQTELTTGTNNNYSPIWSHSGEQIAFVSDRDGNNEIYMLDVTNSKVENLTLDTSNDLSPIWSPDDEKVIFISDRNGNLDIYSVDITTLETENLTNTSDDEYFPVFIPATLPLQAPTSTPSVLIDNSPTANPVTAVLNANPRKGEYPLTVNFSANLRLNDNTLVCNQNPECSYTWLGLLNLPQNVQSFTRTFDGPFTPTITVIVCYQGMCDEASVVIEVTQR